MRSNKWWLDKKGDCSSSRSRRSRRGAAGAMRRNSRWAGDQKLPNAILHFQILPYCRFWRSSHSREKVYWHCWWDNWLSSLVEKQANEGTKENSNHVRCDPDQDPSTPSCLGLIKCSAGDFQVTSVALLQHLDSALIAYRLVWKCWDIAVCALKYFSKRWELVQPCFQW